MAAQAEASGKVTADVVSIDMDILREANRPHPLNFDPNLHKLLNSELKQLYTALTRARVNVWMFDAGMTLAFYKYCTTCFIHVYEIQEGNINGLSLTESVCLFVYPLF